MPKGLLEVRLKVGKVINFDLVYSFQTIVSGLGLGAVLSQRLNGHLAPVAYPNRVPLTVMRRIMATIGLEN